MRNTRIAALSLAVAGFALGSPMAMAQETQETPQEESTGKKLLRGVLQSILGPEGAAEEKSAQDTAATAQTTTLEQVLADPRRDGDRARDVWRHPAETLAFFRVEPDQIVVEYAPGGGWYTRVLAPYLAQNGRYVALTYGPGGRIPERYNDMLNAFPVAFPAKVEKDTGVPAGRVYAYRTDQLGEAMNGTADRVLVVRMMHNLKRWGIADTELEAMRKLLKDDGLLGIVQHRAKPGAPYSFADGSKGYLQQEDLIKLVEAQGFTLVGTSEVNANPADPANHEGGVWELPPSWSSKDEAKKAIGESDRMTLLFKKRL
jgi:predicted methyltransferase